MPGVERKTITLNEKPTSPYVAAIEGLIFDPQPPILVLYSRIDSQSGIASHSWRDPEQRERLSIIPASVSLLRRFQGLVAPRFSHLVVDRTLRRADTDDYLNDSPLYVSESYPMIIVDVDPGDLFPRQLHVDFKEVRDKRTRFLHSYLRLAEEHLVGIEANFFIDIGGVGISRSARDEDLDKPYIPNFTEQQRLLVVSALLAKHLKY